MAQMAISAVGAAAAPFTGGTSMLLSLGMAAGSAALALATRPKNQGSAGKLNDLKMSSSAYGRGIAQVWGTMRVTGNMIWATDIEERRKFVGQKGKSKSSKKAKKGKAQEVHEYFGNFAMGLCEGPMEDVIRIWADSNLIYDKYNPQDAVAPGFSRGDEGGGGKMGANKKGDNTNGSRWPFRFYAGTEEQLQDPYMVEQQGEDMVPAYRGLTYLMFERMPLMDFGNRIPTITAEVVPQKVRQIDLTPWTPLVGHPISVTNSYQMMAALDPTRFRLYQSVGGRSHIVRVWDVSTGREINRLDLGDKNFIGMSGEGNIMAVSKQTWNSVPVYEVDPNTGQTIRSYGGVYPYTTQYTEYESGTSIPYSVGSMPVMRLTALGEVSYTTVLRSIWNHFGSVDRFSGISGNNYKVVGVNHVTGHVMAPAAPDSVGSFWFIGRNNLYLMRAGSFSLGKTADGEAVSYPRTLPSTEPPGNPFMEVVNPVTPGGEIKIQPPIWMTGAECYLMLYTPYQSGAQTYARAFDMKGNVKWNKPIGNFGNSILTHKPYVTYIPVPVAVGSRWGFINNGRYVTIDAATQEVTDEALPANFPKVTGAQFYLDHQSRVIFWGDGASSTGVPHVGWYSAYVDKFRQVSVDVADICRDICEKVGISSDSVNTAEMGLSEVAGYLIENPLPARDALEQLSQVYFFDVCESDYQLKFSSRGKDPLITIPQEHLGIVDGGADNDYYRETITQEIDLPQTVLVSFINADDDYQNGTQHYRRPNSPMPVMHSRDTADISLPIAMTPDQAKKSAEKILYASWAERHMHDLVLPWQYLMYDPTDVLTFEMDDGLTFSDRIIGFDIGADFSLKVAGVVQEHHAYVGTGVGVPSGRPIYIPRPIPPMVTPILMDIPFSDDADQGEVAGDYPLYWGAGAWNPGYQYGSLQLKDPPADYESKGASDTEAVWGTVTEAVPPPPNGMFATDDQTVITLVPAFDYEAAEIYEWESIPAEEWPSNSNMVLIGGEIILFRDVQLTASGAVEISHLIRGHRGTENWADDHTPGERFVILNTDGHKLAEIASISVNEELVGKVASPGFTQMLSPTESVDFKANAMRPYAPRYIKREDAGLDTTISWERRTRFNGGLKNGVGTVPLNEESLAYRLFISANQIDDDTFDPDDETQYVRMVETTSESYLYTDVAKTADGLTETATFYVAVYQMSADVGYGFPGIERLETTAPAYR